MYVKYIKHLLDFIISLILLFIISPFFIVVFILLTLVNKGNPFFVQPRPGKKGKIFRIIKFKTMNNRRDADGKLLPDAERLIPVGKFIRKTSLDEMPQLLNVIQGDMSLVGPRPFLSG